MADKNGEKTIAEKDKPKSEQSIMQKMFIIIISMFIILMILIGIQIYLIFGNKVSPTVTTKTIANVTAASTKSVDKLKNMDTASLDTIIVNLADTDYKRLLKIQVTIAYNIPDSSTSDEMKTTLQAKVPIIKAAVIDLLRTKKVDDISTVQQSKSLQKQMLKTINNALGENFVQDVYFTDFYIQ